MEIWGLIEKRKALLKEKKPTDDIDKRMLALSGRNLLSFLIENDYITGYRKSSTRDDGWVYLKLKKERDGRGLITRLTTTAEGTKLQAKWSYHRAKGLQVPKKIQMLVVPEPNRSFLGVCEYVLKRIKVTLPKN